MASQPGWQTFAIQMLTPWEEQWGNDIWSFNRILWETFLLKNHTKSVVEKVVPELFQQSKLSVSLDQYS